MSEESTSAEFSHVQGSVPVVRFEMNEAYRYMVRNLGKEERIPQRFTEVEDGAAEIVMCMKLRYGEGHTKDIMSLLAWQLIICKDDEDIWGEWRRNCVEQNGTIRLEQRILKWNDGITGYKAGAKASPGVAAARRIPVFTSDDEFENRVDNFNGSRVACDLAEVRESRRRLIRRFSADSEVVPWEQQGTRPSIGKMKEAVGKMLKTKMKET